MKRELETLLAVQAQDAHLRTLQEKLGQLTERRKDLEETLKAEERSLQDEQRRLEDLRRLSRERTAEVDDLDAQIRRYEQQLEEGLLSFKEMEALREKVASSRQRMERLEEEAIELLDRLEEEEEEMAAREKTFSQWRSRIEEEFQELDRSIEEHRRRIAEAEERREALARDVEAALLERYERLSAEYEDPVVPVRDGRCTGCNLRLSETTIERVREGSDIVTCENCLRILYA